MITEINGDIFESKCQVLVNPVNCVGVMGKGLAYNFKSKYPIEMFDFYKMLCNHKSLKLGYPILWENRVLFFPTKNHWRERSYINNITDGLESFRRRRGTKNIESVAFPMLGCGLGGLNKNQFLESFHFIFKDTKMSIELYI